MNDRISEFNKYLVNDDYLMIHINPQLPGVILPEHLKKSENLNLKISNFFVGKLELLKDKIVTELTFDNELKLCEIPWEAIIGYTAIGKEIVIFGKEEPKKERPKLTRIK